MSDDDLIDFQGHVHIPDFTEAAAPKSPSVLRRALDVVFRKGASPQIRPPQPATAPSQTDSRDFDFYV